MWGIHLAIDLDLSVRDANTLNTVGFNRSYDNNVERVAYVGYEDATIEILIRKSGADSIAGVTWYGLTWRSHPL